MNEIQGPGLKVIVQQQYYRLWIIWRIPSVRFLDYQKVKDAERKKASDLFGTAEKPSALASKVWHISPIYPYFPQPSPNLHTAFRFHH